MTIQIPNRTTQIAPNQIIITTEQGEFLQSYNSMIAAKLDSGKVLLDEEYWDYSNTTGKYRNIFLGEDKATTQKKINDGTYVLVNLNK